MALFNHLNLIGSLNMPVAGGTSTIAIPEGDRYRLHGYKWFSSATDSDMTLALARITNKEGRVTEV